MSVAGRLELGMEHHRAGRLDAAAACYREIAAADAQNPTPRYLLGIILTSQGQPSAALREMKTALSLAPSAAEPWVYVGSIRSGRIDSSGAATAFGRAVALSPFNAPIRIDLGNLLRRLGRTTPARRELRRALVVEPGRFDATSALALAHWEAGQTAASRRLFARAVAIDPTNATARLSECVAALPVFYASAAAVGAAREAYDVALTKLELWARDGDDLRGLAGAIGTLQPFYLAYQNHDDRDLQRRYGSLVCRATAARHPELSAPFPACAARRGGRIRIALVSGFFRRHSVWKMALEGWIRGLDRSRFELLGYHTSATTDDATTIAHQGLDRLSVGMTDSAALGRQVRADAPDAVLYPEIGIDPVAARVAAMRLAPVQAMSWGHPTTSGYPTIDYFLSSEEMEPDDGAAHYAEELVRLPGLGCSYHAPSVAPGSFSRADLGLSPTDLVLLCAQSLFKYLPEDDEVLIRIAQELPSARFVFLAGPLNDIADAFRRRLGSKLRTAGIDPERSLVMLPRLDEAGFAGLARVADIVLDSLGWSGFNTTVELIVHGVPVVTLPDRFMRGRHTTAVLRMIDMGDLVATDRADYVAKIASLGRSPGRRSALGRTIAARLPTLFADQRPIRALEAFIERAVVKT